MLIHLTSFLNLQERIQHTTLGIKMDKTYGLNENYFEITSHLFP